jgi:hypothetical protein
MSRLEIDKSRHPGTPETAAMTIAESVRRYIEAAGDGRRDDVAALLHPQLVFRSGPLTHDRDAFLAALERLRPVILRNEIVELIASGDEACVVYDFVTDTPAGAFRSVEWLRFEDGLVRDIRLLFDPERWPVVVAELERRTASGHP